MQIILLEKIESLGALGEEVKVRDGYARNYLLPQHKALRATESNRAYFLREKAALEATNAKKREAAEKESKKLEKLFVSVIRQASEAGNLYGSVSTRDIAEVAAQMTKVAVDRHHVVLNEPIKSLGLFPVTVSLHPEVKVQITVNIARTAEEAEIQKKTGKALVKTDGRNEKVEDEAEAATSEAPEAAEDATEEAAA